MPRFYFHVEDHQRFPDLDGSELHDLESARIEAVRVAGAILCDHAATFWRSGEWRVVVTDADQTVLFSIVCQALAAPAPARTYEPTPA